MPVVGDILGFHDHLEMRLLLAELLERVLRVPLERGLRLGHKARSRRCDTHAARTVGRVLTPAIGDLFANVGNTVQILVCLGRQTHHEIELDVIPAALKGNLAGMEHVLLANVLVDNITQALRTGLTCERQAAFAGFLYALHQFGGKAVRTKRRQ